MNKLIFISIVVLFASCASIGTHPKSQLGDEYYHYRKGIGQYEKVFVEVLDDSIKMVRNDNSMVTIDPSNDYLFFKPSFDIDVLVTLFKYRPSTMNFPRQLTTDFNGNIFLGGQLDRFKVHFINSPKGKIRHIRHRAASVGVFGGIGSTAMTPWTTSQGLTDEYNGFVLSRGIALMIGVNNLTVGAGVGWDYLTDRDKNIWIYQNEAWYGLTLSLHLN